MRNLHVLYSGLGGHGREFFTLAEQAVGSGLRLAAVFYGVEPLLQEYADDCRRLGIPHRYVEKRRGPHLSSWRELHRALVRFQPDVVTLHGPTTILPAWWYCARFGKRLVVVETQANSLKTRFNRLTSRLAMRLADRIVCLTDVYVAELAELCGSLYRASKVQVIPNGIDLSRFRPGGRETAARPCLRIGMQGRLVPIKDHPTLVRAFAGLTPGDGSRPLELHLAGSGEMEGGLRRLAAELGVADRVRFHGMLGQDELVRFMQELDVYVQATLGESFCFSIMEAFACGLPVVASRVPVLDTTLDGLPFVSLVESRDVDSLRAALERLVRDGAARERAGEEARGYAERSLAAEKMFDRHYRLYRELLEGGARSGPALTPT